MYCDSIQLLIPVERGFFVYGTDVCKALVVKLAVEGSTDKTTRTRDDDQVVLFYIGVSSCCYIWHKNVSLAMNYTISFVKFNRGKGFCPNQKLFLPYMDIRKKTTHFVTGEKMHFI